MAERRMFAKSIIDSDMFLDMPLSTQALYFHLSMRADDDGFINNPKKIQRMVGCGDDDLKLLIAKSFIIPFESGIVVIKHWKLHNYIRNDRYKPTIYQEEKSLIGEDENKIYHLGMSNCLPSGIPTDIPMVDETVYQMDTQDRLGKDRLGKDSIGIDIPSKIHPVKNDGVENKETHYQEIVDLFNSTCTSYPRIRKVTDSRKKTIKARLKEGYTIDDFKDLFNKAEESKFLKGENDKQWSATFDWLINTSNMIKVLEDNYKNKRGDGYGEHSGTTEKNDYTGLYTGVDL